MALEHHADQVPRMVGTCRRCEDQVEIPLHPALAIRG
jgi:hypothetical protein